MPTSARNTLSCGGPPRLEAYQSRPQIAPRSIRCPALASVTLQEAADDGIVVRPVTTLALGGIRATPRSTRLFASCGFCTRTRPFVRQAGSPFDLE